MAVVDADRLARLLSEALHARAEVASEGGVWSVVLPGLPIAGEGRALEEALGETASALRDYSEAWSRRLRHSSNHEDNWALVQLIVFSSDDRLKDWVQGP